MPNTPNTLQMMYIGSQIVGPSRPIGLGYARKTDLAPSDMSDDWSKALFTAILMANGQWNLDPTPDNLSTIVVAEGLMKTESTEPEAVAAFRDVVIQKANEYATMGANDTEAFARIETMLHIRHQELLLKQFGMSIAPSITNDPIGSPVEKGEALLSEIQKITSNWMPESSIHTLESQIQKSYEYIQERREMISTRARLMNLPPELGRLCELVPYIRKGLVYTVKGPTKGGKAQPLDEDVLTPTGWTAMGYLRVGDSVIGSNGKPTEIIAVHPQGLKEIFKVTFSDGTSTRCCDDHLWRTKRSDSSDWTIRSLKQIREYGLFSKSGHAYHYIQRTSPVEFDYIDLPVDPYLLGVLLGDGGLTHGSTPVLTTADKEILDSVVSAMPKSMIAKPTGKYGYRLSAKVRTYSSFGKADKSELSESLYRLNLLGKGSADKFIPPEYLCAHLEARIALLQGLMDTDGYAVKGKTRSEYVTISHQLATGVRELVLSLGGRVSVSMKRTSFMYKGEYKQGALGYRLSISLPNEVQPFRLSRKQNNLIQRTQRSDMNKHIVSIESVGELPAQCITVAAQDGLYVTTDYTVTHNSSLMGQMSEHLAKGAKVAYFAFEDSLPRKIFQQTCRLVPGASFEGLERGDYEGYIDRSFEVRQGWEEEGGSWILVHCPGKTAAWVVSVINRIQAQYGLDAVFCDYLQKFSTGDGDRFRGLSQSVELLKQRAEEPGKEIAMFIGSQVTVDAKGETHSRECYDLEMKSQCVFGIKRVKAQADEVFNGITLAYKDEISVWAEIWVEFNNDGGTGKETLINWKPRFMFTHPQFLNAAPDRNFIPVLTRPSQRELDAQLRVQNAYKSINAQDAQPF